MDFNAFHPPTQEVLTFQAQSTRITMGNVNSLHSWGRKSRELLEESKEKCFQSLGLSEDAWNIFFTSGGTEACAKAFSYARNSTLPILINPLEHSCINLPFKSLLETNSAKNHGLLALDNQGQIDLVAIDEKLSKQRYFVFCMASNNETGVSFNISELGEICKKYRCPLFSDWVSHIGKTISWESPKNDASYAFAISGHKIGAGFGTGALCVPKEQDWIIDKEGFDYNPVAAYSMALALERARLDTAENYKLQLLRDQIEEGFLKRVKTGLVWGSKQPRICQTSLFSIPGLRAQEIIAKADLMGLKISGGSACSTGSLRGSNVILALGGSEKQSKEVFRFSYGKNSLKNKNKLLKKVQQFFESI